MTGRLVLMGSGETAPAMVKLHRALIEGAGSGLRAMLDTPFGFQANADDLTAKIGQYFEEAVGAPLEVARWRRRDEPVVTRERSLALLDRSSYVFAGPGSPTYALAHWRDTAVPAALAAVAGRGGAVVMGSAAAVTAGMQSAPVYEIYKVGAEPHWVPGLDILRTITGIEAAVIPHYDNREGGRHDTRFCYLGEQRMALMESLLPDGVGVLGVDEHTAVVFDSGSATVHGAGGLTVRVAGLSHVVPRGSSITWEEIQRLLSGTGEAAAARVNAAGSGAADETGRSSANEPAEQQPSVASLAQIAATARVTFDACLADADADGALEAALGLEEAIHAWASDVLEGPDSDQARRVLRGMIVDLASTADRGLADPRDVLGPVVEIALLGRAAARVARDYALSDQIRDGLLAAGVEVQDTPEGQTWNLASPVGS